MSSITFSRLPDPGVRAGRVARYCSISISIERGPLPGAIELFLIGLAKVGNPPRADLYPDSNEGPVWDNSRISFASHAGQLRVTEAEIQTEALPGIATAATG